MKHCTLLIYIVSQILFGNRNRKLQHVENEHVDYFQFSVAPSSCIFIFPPVLGAPPPYFLLVRWHFSLRDLS